ncbi:hypothetical protein BJX99DRAFT_222086 [Aspergillus californicus]
MRHNRQSHWPWRFRSPKSKVVARCAVSTRSLLCSQVGQLVQSTDVFCRLSCHCPSV